MPLDLTDCTFHGPALPDPFVKFELEKELTKLNLLRKTTGPEGKQLDSDWDVYRRNLRALAASGGQLRVRNHVIEPLIGLLGYSRLEAAEDVRTREEMEPGGFLLIGEDGQSKIRVWTTAFNEDLYAPYKRGRAYRFSHLRIAQRVLLTTGERIGLLTNGIHLLLLISDPARPDSTISIPLDPGWKRSREVPDSFLFVMALASPDGVKALPDIVDKARLQQARVTKELRTQAREAVERFIQEIIDHPHNREWFDSQADREALAKALWREGLIVVYRLLFVLKLEAGDDVARSFTFASTSLWRNTFSPSTTLACYAHDVLERGTETGGLLEHGFRSLFRMFEEGLECTELPVKPLGGALFGKHTTPILSELAWGERAVAWLLDRLLWTPKRRGAETRERVHYGPLDVEDLGRVYEALLELEPGITVEPVCRLRRQRLEVVVPLAQGEKYRPTKPVETDEASYASNGSDESENDDDEASARANKAKVEWEEIPPGRFYLRVGLGRKSSGSYYTPHSFVRFLVQQTLGSEVSQRSPRDNPNPLEILRVKVLDPAMGSGHFLVEACRFLGDALYESCRLCDEQALEAERRAEKGNKAVREEALAEAQKWRQRVIDLPDPDDELLKYLPSRSPEGGETGYSQPRALAICRRLVATHCLYGVDKNPLAVELAKLALWLESHAQGMPLTFLDHRLVVGDSLTGPFWYRLTYRPGNPVEPVEGLFDQGLNLKFRNTLEDAIRYVHRLEASVGVTVAEIKEKEAVKAQLDSALLPFRIIAAAWSGGVMLGPEQCDDGAYTELLRAIADTGDLPERIESERLRNMITRGLGVEEAPLERIELYNLVTSQLCIPGLPYDLTFPEVFYPKGVPQGQHGFHAVLGNPPWDKLRVERRDLLASVDPEFLTGKEAAGVGDEHLLIARAFDRHPEARWHENVVAGTKRVFPLSAAGSPDALEVLAAAGDMDQYRLFLLLSAALANKQGSLGFVLGGGFAKNPADAAGRRFLFDQFNVTVFVHYLNLNQLFDGASSRVSFVLLAGSRRPCGDKVQLGFDLTRFEDVLQSEKATSSLKPISIAVVRQQLQADGDLTKLVSPLGSHFSAATDVISGLTSLGIQITNDLHRTNAKPALRPLADVLSGGIDARCPEAIGQLIPLGFACCYDGRSFDQYDSLPTKKSGKWLPQVLIVADLRHPLVKRVRQRLCFYRLAWRSTCGHPKTNERSARACLLPPGSVAGNSILLEQQPMKRPNMNALLACSVINTFSLDSQLRPAIQSLLNKGVMSSASWPTTTTKLRQLLIHSALRLVAINHLYAPLWHEQLGACWREAGKSLYSWPVLRTDDERWSLRAVIDAAVADAYGVSREHYEQILSVFRHSSYPTIPKLCLARFDELKELGLEAFAHKYDPYSDISLNEALPEPVIHLTVGNDEEFRLTGIEPAAE